MTWLVLFSLSAIALLAASDEIYTLRATCDNMMTVFVDGVEQKAEGLTQWHKESKIPVPSNFKVIGIKCVDVGVIPGILASVHDGAGDDILVTDESWTCTQEAEKGWAEPGFASESVEWEEGDVIGKHGASPWKFIGQISRKANWIWTKDHKIRTTVYCRYEPVQVQVQTYTLRATCDNVMTVFVDGVEKKAEGLTQWHKESKISVPSNFEVIGIKCADNGVVGGILASLHDENGEIVVLTDDTWLCTQNEEENWAQPGFEVDFEAWEEGEMIRKHDGVKPWRGFVGDISREASWIWTKDHKIKTTVYCRYVPV